MKTCPYCSTNLRYSVCDFCGYVGEGNENGERSNKYKIRNFFSLQRAIQPLAELEKCHTHDLLYGLKLVRAERVAAYDVLKSVNALGKHFVGDDEYKKTRAEAGENYEFWTKRAWILENILMDRLGYFPERIEDSTIDEVNELSKKVSSKQMGFLKRRIK